MTELNPEPNPEKQAASGAEPATPDTPDTRIDWPASSLGAAAQDPAVGALLERLDALPGRPVAGHGEVYAGLHEDLMEALNEDLSGQPGAVGPGA
jgi:hypothetical protein